MKISELKKFVERFDDNEPVVLALIQKDDVKYLKRSVENNVAVILQEEPNLLNSIYFGRIFMPDKSIRPAIYLTL